MKYTERFFKFPTRVADGFETAKLNEELNKGNTSEKPIIPTIDSYYKLPFQQIEGWQEMYPPETDFNDVIKKGFECSLVFTKDHGDLLCSWTVKKFEEKLNEHVDKLEEYSKTLKKSDSNSINPA